MRRTGNASPGAPPRTGTAAGVGAGITRLMGSFQGFDQKPSLVVKFDKYTPDQDYLGLSKLMLNNSVQDGTYLAELMATQMFRDAGVPAARVTHAFVELNGRKPVLYVLIEAMNKDFLKQHFKKPGLTSRQLDERSIMGGLS